VTDHDPSKPIFSRRDVIAHAAQGAAVVSIVSAPAYAAAGKNAKPIDVSTKTLSARIDVANCRWSVTHKPTGIRFQDIYFLPGNDPAGWNVESSIVETDKTKYGVFSTIVLRGTKAHALDFEYRIMVDKSGDDILVSLGRANNTGKPVDLFNMDYFVCDDVRLGGSTDKWISLGTCSRNREYYELLSVQQMVTPKSYEVNHLVRDADTGNCLLMGHATAMKGASRFEVMQGWQDTGNDRMGVRGYCSYKVTMPAGEKFPGEQLLINFSTDGLHAMEHQADLIDISHDVRLKQRRPINLDDPEWVANSYSRFHSWMSGGNAANARKFFDEHNLRAFYLGGTDGSVQQASFALYGSGGAVNGRPNRTNLAPECYLPVGTPKYHGERVLDLSNPVAQKQERDRAFQWAATDSHKTGAAEMDFADYWDKWPGQTNPYMTALETYRAGGLPWRQAIDQVAPRRYVRSNMNVVDHSYGIVDICRISEDADRGYEFSASTLLPPKGQCLFTETVIGSANRFFYNGRVFWNDGDGFHVYKYVGPDGKKFNAEQAKVVANFRALANNTILVSEAFDEPYPEDRIELLKRISPPTMDTAYPVDLFVRKPAQVWNMPVARPFGSWRVLGVFNYTHQLRLQPLSNSIIQMLDGTNDTPFFTELTARDLRLDPGKEYIAYEFWSRTLLGTFKGMFKPRPVKPYDCDIYSIVEKQNHPVLISTSRHVRQMAFDIKALSYDASAGALRGVSRAVADDPYQLRIYVPDGFKAGRVTLSDGLNGEMKTNGNLLTVDFTSTSGKDVTWAVFF
jgi:hypothetical protein